ncbi:hypothetical protein GCM10022228_20150 [Halomonas cibimaris]|uniref:Uroporphyrin-3 C-methyltransferase n=1 Tax=Halomonas cibimaris TaxID=657012 RepID=A0ABP7LXA0_9GAMM
MNQHDNEQSDVPKAAANAKRDDAAAGKGSNKSGAKPAKNTKPPESGAKPAKNAGRAASGADGKAAASKPGKPPGAGNAPAQSGGGSAKGTAAIVLALIVAAALALLAWQGWQRLQGQQQRLDTLAASVDGRASQQRVDALAARLESGEKDRDQSLESALGSLRSEFSDYRQSVNKTLDKVLTQLSQEQDTDARDWLHAEAAYLLRLANQRLQLEGDVQGAAALLRSADARLKDADNPALTAVRREIARDLSALQAVPDVDVSGLYLALDAQQERIQTLRLDQDVEAQKVESGMQQAPSGTFQRQLARFGQELKDLVVVRKHDDALEALVTPKQEAYLRQSLRLITEQAQLALLKQEETLYTGSIDDALELINGYFDTDRADTQSVMARFKELKQKQITPELPDISGSQQALAEFIDKRFNARRAGGGDA